MSAPFSIEPPVDGSGTWATRALFASTRASVPDPADAITSTRSPGRSSRTVAASAIRTGADTSRTGGDARSRAVPAGCAVPVAA